MEDIKKTREMPTVTNDVDFNRNKWFFSLGGIGRDMAYSLVASYFFMYVQFGLSLSVAQFATLSILIGVLGRIWDGINDPLMGTIIDACNFKWGKFKPWILIGAVLTGGLLLVMFNLRPFGTTNADGWVYVGLMVFIYLLWEAAFTMNDIGYWGAIPSLSRKKENRDKLTTMVIFCAGIGGGIISLIVGFFSPGNILTAYTIYSIIACVGIIFCQTMVCFTVKEGPRVLHDKEEKESLKKTFKIIFKNKQLLWISIGFLLYDIGSGILGALLYNLYYLEFGYDGTFAVVALVMGVFTMALQLLYPKITKNWSRKKIQKIALLFMILGYGFIALLGWTSLLPFTPVTLAIGYLLTGIGGTYFYITTLINMTNCVEYNEYLTCERNEAVVSAVRPLIVKFGSATKSLLTTVILIVSGLYVLSQQVSSLETQKNLLNDKIVEKISSQGFDDMKYYIDKINEYGYRLKGLEGEVLDNMTSTINSEIEKLDNPTLKEVQTQAEYISMYQQMYILKYSNNELVDFKQIKDIDTDEFFDEDYRYEASFVFSYIDENGNKVDVNIADKVYKESDSLSTRIILRIMVTIVPVIIAFLSYYVQNKKYIVNEEFYKKMVEELNRRREANVLDNIES